MTARGFGGSIRSPRVQPAGGGGVTGANNGLTLVGANVQLGGVNPLIQNTDILLDIFTFSISDGLAFNPYFLIDNALRNFGFGDIGGNFNSTALIMDDSAQGIILGTNTAGGAGSLGIRIDGPNELIELRAFNEPVAFFINSGGGAVYTSFGDVGSFANSTVLEIDDALQQLNFISGAGQFLLVDVLNGDYVIGDSNVTANGTYLSLADGTNTADISSNGQFMLSMSQTTGDYQYGDIGALGNGSFIIIRDNATLFQFLSNTNDIYLSMDVSNGNYQIGDISTVGNGTFVSVDDNQFELRVNAVNGINVIGDTVMIHTSTTWADGAAAQAGTLLNAPLPGNPTKWIPVDDNGTTRHIPAW